MDDPPRAMARRSTLSSPETTSQAAAALLMKTQKTSRSLSGTALPSPSHFHASAVVAPSHACLSTSASSVRAWLDTLAAAGDVRTARARMAVFWAVMDGLQHARCAGERRNPLYPSLLLLEGLEGES